MKKKQILFLFVTLVGLFFVSTGEINALDNSKYYMSKLISFPSDISKRSGTLTIDEHYSNYKTYYQWQNISEENYNKILEAQKKYETDLANYKEEKSAAADKVVEACGFIKENVLNFCQLGGGDYDCVSLSEDEENSLSDECKSVLEDYDMNYIEFKTSKEPKAVSNYDLLPDIDEDSWIETDNNKFSVDNSLSGKYVLYAKVVGTYAGWITKENNVSYGYNIYNLTELKSETKDISTIYNDSGLKTTDKVVTEDSTSTTTIKQETNNTEEKQEKQTEKNPKTGLNNNYMYIVIISVVTVASYLVIVKVKKFI
jgi:hypothetical protein